jgi:FMN phosphatase YigB (HAD superfamily)
MDSRFKSIKVIAWDLDGTLYRLNDQIWQVMHAAQYRVISNHLKISLEQAKIEHQKIYPAICKSSQQAVAQICHIGVVQALQESEFYYDRTDFVSRDDQLVDLFSKLFGFRHIMFVNGWQIREEPVLYKLGLDPKIFETWITPIVSGVLKPDAGHFQAILNYTHLLPEEHMIVGDREDVDLINGVKIGMHTALVWSNVPGKFAEITLPSVYDLAGILL